MPIPLVLAVAALCALLAALLTPWLRRELGEEAARLPDRMVVAAAGLLFVGLAVSSAVEGDWSRLGRAALAALALVVGYFVLAFINPAGLGLGDVKFAGVVGGFLGWFGWAHLGAGTLAAFVLNAVVALVVLLARSGGKDTDIPFGPWMVAGAVAAVALLPTQ
ncbi:prepilin peptidase [Tessaracoccus rhinocerotis]|uniref:Prepilin peptidase n=1 Tax=Tessaracoccus rhinocerotis TaxID=1689449 RepID=A0A553JXT5_9ACTN|nr:prepilin peptidase [Tessaracoccus rhinocerotis]TRY17268.1 prepilin peptidase [Tessaracoccus rhinocerotis]